MNNSELAKKIYRLSHIQGEFRLRSGQISTEYFDKYLFEGQPEILREISEAMGNMVPPATQLLAGLELGGVPVATMLSQVTGIASVYVRKKPKTYGTCRLAEGGDVTGKQVAIVEDVITSGGQVIESVEQLRALGAKIDSVLCVIDRESGGKMNLEENGLTLMPLFTMSELKATVGH